MQDSDDDFVLHNTHTECTEGEGSMSVSPLSIDLEDCAESLSKETVLLVYKNNLLQLARKCIMPRCDICQEVLSLSDKMKGSCIVLSWACCNGHVAYRWSSQQTIRNGLHAGDLMLAAAIFMSGNNYAKIELLAQCLGLSVLREDSYYHLQRRYIVPVVEDYWKEMVSQMMEDRKHMNVTIMGDGRMDSPGHCAQYCTYTCMDEKTKEILLVHVVDKRETELISPRMENFAFERCVKSFQDCHVNINEVVTDAHPQIAKAMRTKYASVSHSFDMWHGAKNLSKRINKAGQQRGCRIICQWTKQIVNHFWHCCQHSDNLEDFMIHWRGVLYHVVNQHEWDRDPNEEQPLGRCQHDSLGTEHTAPWLEPENPAHEKLKDILLDPKFVEKVRHYLSYRTTAELEQFQQLILKYASKRQAYTFPAYRARNFMAAIDHNSHHGRPYHRNKDGRQVYRRKFNKKSGRWTVVRKKVKKDYRYFIPLKRKILLRRLTDCTRLRERATLGDDDPRKIQPSIATYPPPDKPFGR
ncbi:uncharacterized protein LOC122801710 [Protopterus annectens]|uniref:uncharacterized protein LOC122801710 n=1 Tax=Protopterus annectens TaxID=7888 RepID=UPI001CF97368|nr:uncharacterized protein LOC122801710 [Protopterus annectens]